MKVAFLTVFLNHHQVPLCLALAKYADEFTLILTQALPEKAESLGYHEMNDAYDFILRTYDGSTPESKIEQVIRDCDVVIYGGAPYHYYDLRKDDPRPSFIYIERFFRRGMLQKYYPKARKRIYQNASRYNRSNYFALCASAFGSQDVSRCGFSLEKCFKWGYFPEVKALDADELFSRKRHEIIRILWVGRLIWWKFPEDAVSLAEQLKENGIAFSMEIIGEGDCEGMLARKIAKEKLSDCVTLAGSMHPEDIRLHMEEAEIFVFTSGRKEGWGAVVNEAMSSGCAVVADAEAGSVPYLIENGKDGFIYRSRSVSELYEKTVRLIKNPVERERMGRAAYQKMKTLWNADVAAERFIKTCRDYKDGGVAPLYKDGPMSPAEYLKNNWFRDDC